MNEKLFIIILLLTIIIPVVIITLSGMPNNNTYNGLFDDCISRVHYKNINASIIKACENYASKNIIKE